MGMHNSVLLHEPLGQRQNIHRDIQRHHAGAQNIREVERCLCHARGLRVMNIAQFDKFG